MGADFFLFVYGTLRAGGGNEHLLEGRSEHMGTVRTRDSYTMFTDNLDFCPYLTDLDLGNLEPTKITGELYRLPYSTLQDIDALEGHPDWYKRREVVLEGGQVAWAYFLTDGCFQQMRQHTLYYLPSGNWFEQDDALEVRAH